MQLEQALDFAIRDLDAPLREVVLLRDVEGLAAKEVAEVLGISVDAVKSRLHRARSALRERLAPLTEGASPTQGRGACPDIVELLSQYQEGDVDAAACQKMEAHVASCPTCSVRCTSLRRVLTACGSAPAPQLSEALKAEVLQQIRRSLRRNQV
jgi:RNA polymerase sigma-70 factor (ECF subfamily)